MRQSIKIFSPILLAVFVLSITAAAQVGDATKTITNSDLAKFRAQRLKNDPEDERERQRLGLPSRAEQEREQQIRRQKLSEIAARIRAQQSEAENFWQEQAFELKAEIAQVEAEINYLRARIGSLRAPQISFSTGYLPYYGNCCFNNFGLAGTNQIDANKNQSGRMIYFGSSPRAKSPRDYTTVKRNPSLIAPSGGENPARGFFKRGGFYRRQILPVPFVYPAAFDLTREELFARLLLLEQNRAGLYARFSVLQDEAHRAGIKIY